MAGCLATVATCNSGCQPTTQVRRPHCRSGSFRRAILAGRMVFERKGTAKWIQCEEGSIEADPKRISDALLATRESIWFSKGYEAQDASPILGAYMQGRSHNSPTRSPPQNFGARSSPQREAEWVPRVRRTKSTTYISSSSPTSLPKVSFSSKATATMSYRRHKEIGHTTRATRRSSIPC